MPPKLHVWPVETWILAQLLRTPLVLAIVTRKPWVAHRVTASSRGDNAFHFLQPWDRLGDIMRHRFFGIARFRVVWVRSAAPESRATLTVSSNTITDIKPVPTMRHLLSVSCCASSWHAWISTQCVLEKNTVCFYPAVVPCLSLHGGCAPCAPRSLSLVWRNSLAAAVRDDTQQGHIVCVSSSVSVLPQPFLLCNRQGLPR